MPLSILDVTNCTLLSPVPQDPPSSYRNRNHPRPSGPSTFPPRPQPYQCHPSNRTCPPRIVALPEDIGGVPVYLGLGGCKGGPIFPRLVLVPLQLLTNLLDDPSNGLDSGVEFYLPLLYHNCICIIYLYY